MKSQKSRQPLLVVLALVCLPLFAADALASQNSIGEFTKTDVRFESIQPGETTGNRVIDYRVHTCFADSYKNKKVVASRQTDEINKTVSFDLRTDDKGCVSFSDELQHNYYLTVQNNFVERDYKYSLEAGETYTTKIFLNPFDDQFTFGRSIDFFPGKLIDKLRSQKVRQILKVVNYRSAKTSAGKTLLAVAPHVLFALDSGSMHAERLRSGMYLLAIEIVEPKTGNILFKTTQALPAQTIEEVDGATTHGELLVFVDNLKTTNDLKIRMRTKPYEDSEIDFQILTEKINLFDWDPAPPLLVSPIVTGYFSQKHKLTNFSFFSLKREE